MIDTIDPDEGMEFWAQVQEHERQQYEQEIRLQRLRESLIEMLEKEAAHDSALAQGIRECLSALDSAFPKTKGAA